MNKKTNKQESPQIFLSYAREDRATVAEFYEKLAAAGFKPWMDVKDIPPDERWENSITRALREADFVLVFLSEHATSKRGFIQKEIRSALETLKYALEDDIYLIPIRLDDCPIPEPLIAYQVLSIYEESAWDRLLKAISVGVERRGKVTLRETLEEELDRPHLFVAMPFSGEMEDVYFYGIQRAADATGFLCKRIDEESFTGYVLQQMKASIETSSAVIADLSGANPNVYLEVGYAWGKGTPVILLVQDTNDLKFDVRGQRCLTYKRIWQLEEVLTRELETLKAKGLI